MAAKQRVQQEALHGAAFVDALKENAYVQRLLADDDVRARLQEALGSSKAAYTRASKKGRRGGAKQLVQDQKLQEELRAAFEAAKSVQSALKDAPIAAAASAGKKGGKGRLLSVALVGGIVAVALSASVRDKLLDLLFGPEETFDYVPTANGNGAAPSSSSPSSSTTTAS